MPGVDLQNFHEHSLSNICPIINWNCFDSQKLLDTKRDVIDSSQEFHVTNISSIVSNKTVSNFIAVPHQFLSFPLHDIFHPLQVDSYVKLIQIVRSPQEGRKAVYCQW